MKTCIDFSVADPPRGAMANDLSWQFVSQTEVIGLYLALS